MRILIVEDEKDLSQILVKHLRNHGYAADSCFDGRSACDYLEMAEYDLVILDIMLPQMEGTEVLRWARKKKLDVPIMLLTAKDSVEDKVEGLDLGADDYLTKPFALEELLARVRMLLRKNSGVKTNQLEIADLRMDVSARKVFRNRTEIFLSAKEFSLLHYLMANQGQILSREQIEGHLWDYSYEGASNMVDVYIRYLRKKIDENFEPRLIHTVRGAGYVLRCQEQSK